MQSSFKQIVDEIVARHHSVLRRELPRISEMMDALSVDCPDKLGEAQELYKKVRTKVETHLKDEETVLFPTGISLDSRGTAPATDMDLLARVEEMEKEHDGCANALGTLCQMIDAVDKCELRDQLLDTIRLVREDLQIHAEKENTQVHPRLIQLLGAQLLQRS